MSALETYRYVDRRDDLPTLAEGVPEGFAGKGLPAKAGG